MRLGRLLACVAVSAALIVTTTGCGGDDDASGKPASVPKGWVEGKAPPGLADVADRLEDAGYTVSAPKARDASFLRVGMESGGSAYVGVKTRDLTAKQVAETNKSTRGRVHAEIAGADVYIVSSGEEILGGKKRLAAAQLREFEEIVAIGTGES